MSRTCTFERNRVLGRDLKLKQHRFAQKPGFCVKANPQSVAGVSLEEQVLQASWSRS